MTIATRPFDPAAYLDTPEARRAYLAGALADGDPAEIADARDVIDRARLPPRFRTTPTPT
ncbi:MAG: hypothetical protein KGI51_01610 [Rhodospirillales bacterium]|nr:hypothetical protein [Rhodospirillales bacterium]